MEYAREAVSKGSMSMGMIYKNGLLMIVEKRIPYTLVVPESIEKIFKLEENIICATSGLIADARVLVEYAREEMMDYRLRYDEKMPVAELVKRISNIKRIYTQYGGVRPFGVSLLIAGIDDSGMNLFETDPSGAYKKYSAGSIGEGKEKILELFEEKYSNDLDFTEAVGISFSAISTALNKEIKEINLEMVTITKENNVKYLSEKDISELKKAIKF